MLLFQLLHLKLPTLREHLGHSRNSYFHESHSITTNGNVFVIFLFSHVIYPEGTYVHIWK